MKKAMMVKMYAHPYMKRDPRSYHLSKLISSAIGCVLTKAWEIIAEGSLMSAAPAAGLDPAAVNPDQTKPSKTVLINVVQFATKNEKRQSNNVFCISPTRTFSPLRTHQIPASVNSIPAMRNSSRAAAGARCPGPAEKTVRNELSSVVRIPGFGVMNKYLSCGQVSNATY